MHFKANQILPIWKSAKISHVINEKKFEFYE